MTNGGSLGDGRGSFFALYLTGQNRRAPIGDHHSRDARDRMAITRRGYLRYPFFIVCARAFRLRTCGFSVLSTAQREGIEMSKLKGKIAIVTGVSRPGGIGAAICRALAREGADIFLRILSNTIEAYIRTTRARVGPRRSPASWASAA